MLVTASPYPTVRQSLTEFEANPMQTPERRTPRLAPRRFSACALLALGVFVGGCQRNATPPRGGGAALPEAQPTGSTEPKPPAFEATGGIDPKVIAAWEQAGATFGWEVPGYGGASGKTLLETQFMAARPKAPPYLPAFSAGKQGLPGLSSLPSPEAPFALGLHGSPLTEADLEALPRFRNLRSLSLVATELRDARLRALGGLQQVEVLKLGGNRISDAGLKELAGLKGLKFLTLGVTNVRGPGLKELAGLPKLETLRLYSLDAPDAVCKWAAGVKQLRALDLHLSKLTDTGLKELAPLKELDWLNVVATDVTDAGVAEIRKALPKCQVQRR